MVVGRRREFSLFFPLVALFFPLATRFFSVVTLFCFQPLSGVAQGSDAKAIYGYRAQNKDELSFMAGDKIKVPNRKTNSFQTLSRHRRRTIPAK
jgi:hypothetical protein